FAHAPARVRRPAHRAGGAAVGAAAWRARLPRRGLAARGVRAHPPDGELRAVAGGPAGTGRRWSQGRVAADRREARVDAGGAALSRRAVLLSALGPIDRAAAALSRALGEAGAPPARRRAGRADARVHRSGPARSDSALLPVVDRLRGAQAGSGSGHPRAE